MEKSLAQKALESAFSEELTNWNNASNHDKVNIALGILSAEKSDQLTNSIIFLQKQLALSIGDLRTTIGNNTDKIIGSNEKLSTSNEKYAQWMKWLTAGLVFVGIVQIIVSVLKG